MEVDKQCGNCRADMTLMVRCPNCEMKAKECPRCFRINNADEMARVIQDVIQKQMYDSGKGFDFRAIEINVFVISRAIKEFVETGR